MYMFRGYIKSFLIVAFTLLSIESVNANAGGGVYRFLNLPFNAKLAGLGGENVSVQSDDVNQFYTNPALLSSSLNSKISLSYVNYLADANGGMASYSYALDSLNYFGFNFLFMGYGDLEGYDRYGNATEEFSAGDFAWNLVYARYLGSNFTVGLAMKPVYSHIESYSSFGLGFDVGANYYKKDWDFSVGLSVRNFGFRFTDYYDDQDTERLPWNIQLGITKGLEHAPFRFSITYDHLNDWSLDYKRPEKSNSLLSLEETDRDQNEIKFADMLFRHLVFGVEVLIGKNFHFDMAYNHRRNREYALSEARGMNGFSFGAGLKVYKFNLDAAYAKYAPSGGTFTLSLSSSIDSFKKNEKDNNSH